MKANTLITRRTIPSNDIEIILWQNGGGWSEIEISQGMDSIGLYSKADIDVFIQALQEIKAELK